MSDEIRCPDCGTLTPCAARFCPGCGRPRFFVREDMAQQALSSGEAYTDLIDRARAETLASEDLLVILARLERRLNEVESLTRHGERRGTTPQPAAARQTTHVAAAPRPLEQPALAPEASVDQHSSMPVPEAKPGIDIESLITGRILGWVGGLAIALGAAFFLSLAFSNGWIGPAPRVLIGVVASMLMLAGGAWFFERKEAFFGHVLVATALGIMSLSLVAATRLYDFLPAHIGVLAALAVAALAAIIAIRANSQTVAIFGLIAALIAPPLVGASASYSTLAFVAVALAGTVSVALYRSWRWLPVVAFVLSAPQAANWLTGDVSAVIAIAVLAGFWTLYVLAAGGEAFRRTTDRLSPSSTTVMVANAAFLLLVGFDILSGDLEGWRGLFLLGAAHAYGTLGGYFLYLRHERHPFGMLTLATGIAALALAVPVQAGGPVVAAAWAAQATALAWVYTRRQHEYSGAFAAILALLSAGHLFTFEYPLRDLPQRMDSTVPYINSSGATLGFILAALVVTGLLSNDRLLRSLLIVAGSALIALSAPFEMSAAAAVTLWAALAGGLWLLAGARLFQRDVPRLAATVLSVAGIGWTLVDIAPPGRLFVDAASTVSHPLFWSSASVALAALAATFTIGYWTLRNHRAGRMLAIVAAALAVYLLSIGVADEFQRRVGGAGTLDALQKQSQVALSILWAGLGVLAFVAGLVRNTAVARSFGLALLALATVKVFIYDLASLDASYRVLSFIGLGIILLASSFAYQHFVPLFDRQLRGDAPLDDPSG